MKPSSRNYTVIYSDVGNDGYASRKPRKYVSEMILRMKSTCMYYLTSLLMSLRQAHKVVYCQSQARPKSLKNVFLSDDAEFQRKCHDRKVVNRIRRDLCGIIQVN